MQSYVFHLFPVVPILGHKASEKRFVSLRFLNSETVGRKPWTGEQYVTRPLLTQDNTNKE
jgi:hypothetical protein